MFTPVDKPLTVVVGLFGLAKLPVPFTTDHVPCTGHGSWPASVALVPQTFWSGPAFDGVKGGVTWTAKSTTSPDVLGGYPYIEVDARGAKPKALWDTKTNPYDTNWDDAP